MSLFIIFCILLTFHRLACSEQLAVTRPVSRPRSCRSLGGLGGAMKLLETESKEYLFMTVSLLFIVIVMCMKTYFLVL